MSRYDAPCAVNSMTSICIERIQNGFTVTATDPKIAAENEKSSKWKDSRREYRFDSVAAVCKFIEKIAEEALPVDPAPPDPFGKAFDAAVKATSDNDGDE